VNVRTRISLDLGKKVAVEKKEKERGLAEVNLGLPSTTQALLERYPLH